MSIFRKGFAITLIQQLDNDVVAGSRPLSKDALSNMTSFGTLQARLNGKSIPALDGIRAIAVSLVIFYHFGFSHVPGAHGVMIFFVLSGFLITWLLLKESERDGNISLKGFYTRRVLRIFPAFYVFWLLVVGLLLVTGRQPPWSHAWSALFYVSNYYSALHPGPGDEFTHTWSLAIEEQFYVLWPLLFIQWQHNLPRMTVGLIAMIGCVWLYRAVMCWVFDVSQSYTYNAFEFRLDQLLVGCLLAVLLKRGSLQSLWNGVSSHGVLPLATIGVLFVSIVVGPACVYRYRDVFGFAFEPLLYAVLIVQFVGLSARPMWRWLDSRVCRFIGRISYPLYLYQQVTLWPVRKYLNTYPVFMQLGAALCVTIAIAAVSFYLVERPFLRLKDRRRGGCAAPRSVLHTIG